MKEEADTCVGKPFAKHGGQKKQVIIVNPDGVTMLVIPNNALGKSFVDLDIVTPGMILVGLALWVVRNLIMEDWPENCLAVVRVVAVKVVVVDIDCDGVIFTLEF